MDFDPAETCLFGTCRSCAISLHGGLDFINGQGPGGSVVFFTKWGANLATVISLLGMRSAPDLPLVIGAKTILFLSSKSPIVDGSNSLCAIMMTSCCVCRVYRSKKVIVSSQCPLFYDTMKDVQYGLIWLTFKGNLSGGDFGIT
jgi:hypothetical protein